MPENLFVSSASEVTRLIMCRHAETPANQAGRIGSRADIPLSDQGSQQAQQLGKRLAPLKPAAIYSSPQLRARLTVQPLAEALGLDIQVEPTLNELDMGITADYILEEIAEEYPSLWAKLDAWLKMGPDDDIPRPAIPEGEPMESLVERVTAFKDRIVDQYPGQTVVAATHLAAVKALFTTVAGGSMGQHSAFQADNASVSVIDFHNRMPIIRQFNDIAHLDIPLKYGRVVII